MQIKLQAFCALIATAAFSPDGLSGAAALQTRGGENGVLSEDLQEDMDYDESISMSMSMPNYDTTFDCSALQHLWNTDPTSIEGSDLFLIKEDCDRGLISTAAEVAEAMEAFEGPYQPSIDEQFTTMADKICAHALNETDSEDFEEILDACEENPRDNEKVVDALARLVAEQTPQEDEDRALLQDTCISIQENRREIEQALLVLASRSDEQRRRLDNYRDHPVTAFEIGSDVLSFFDCYCDTSNPGNDGCTKRAMVFAEAVSNSVIQETEKIVQENPAEVLLKTQSSLQKYTNHLRQSGSLNTESSGQYSSVDRALNQVQEGKCDPPGVQQGPTGTFSLCLYAGPTFECELGWDPRTIDSAQCLSMSCGGSPNVVKLKAEVKYCPAEAYVEMELKACVDVISDLLEVIGQYVSTLETYMNQSFGIYGGCLRLAWAKYDMNHQRLETTASRTKSLPGIPAIEGKVTGNSWMGFKEYGCAYSDSLTWFAKQVVAYNRETNFMTGSYLHNDYMDPVFKDHNDNGGCVHRAGPWAWFELTFQVGFNYIWDTEWLFKESVRFTAASDNTYPNGVRVDGYHRSHWGAPNGYYFFADMNKWKNYFGSITSGITVKQCRGGREIWTGKIRHFSHDDSIRRWDGAEEGNWLVFDRVVKTGDKCANRVNAVGFWPGVPAEKSSQEPLGQYFNFDMNKWKAYFGSFKSGDVISVKQCRDDTAVYSGKIIAWDNHNGKHGRRDPYKSAGDWKDGDYIVKSSSHCYPFGKYFKFDAGEWKEYFGSFNSNGDTRTIKQCRDGATVYTGSIIAWDNDNGIHGRRDPSSSGGDWKVDDYIVTSGGSCSI